MLNLEHKHRVIRPARRAHSSQPQRHNHVPAHPVVLPHGLGILLAPVQRRGVILREADDGLQEQKDVGYEAEDGVRRLEVLVAGALLVDLDDDEAGEQGGDAEEVEDEVPGRAVAFLGRGVRGLEDEDGLGC